MTTTLLSLVGVVLAFIIYQIFKKKKASKRKLHNIEIRRFLSKYEEGIGKSKLDKNVFLKLKMNIFKSLK